jgi:hypothetical protein
MILIIACAETITKWKWIDTLPKPWLLTESEISELLPEFQKRFPKFEERLKAFAIWRIGTPYDIFKLGEENPPDTDPIIRLDVSDCTVHVLTSLAFVQSNTWDEARKNLIEIHYKPDSAGNKIPTYESRWHFTADRLLSNPSTVNISADLLDSDDRETIEIELNIKEDGKEFLDIGWSRKVEIAFIPNEMINEALFEKLPEVCGISFVRKKYFKNGIVIGHEGILIDQQDLIHASSTAGKTVKVDIMNYYFDDDGPIFDGIMIYKFVPIEEL